MKKHVKKKGGPRAKSKAKAGGNKTSGNAKAKASGKKASSKVGANAKAVTKATSSAVAKSSAETKVVASANSSAISNAEVNPIISEETKIGTNAEVELATSAEVKAATSTETEPKSSSLQKETKGTDRAESKATSSSLKKYIQRFVGVLAGLLIFLLLCGKLNYMYVTYDAWFDILFDSYYKQENIDNLFVGSSHVYCDVDPRLLDDINGKNNFNMASAGQRWDSNYYLLKDAIENHDIENVYLECYYLCGTEYPKFTDSAAAGGAAAGVIADAGDTNAKATANANAQETLVLGADGSTYTNRAFEVMDYIEDEDNFTRPWQITYEMKPSLNKYALLLHSANKDYMMETLFPFVRYRTNVFDWDVVKTNIETKNSDAYKNHTYSAKQWDADGTPYTVEYLEKGFFRTEGKLLDQEKKFLATRDLSQYGIGDVSEKYIRKCIELCKDNDIPVKLFVSPIYDLKLISTIDYDAYVSELQQIADDCNIELYDFNLIKDDYLDIKNGDYFYDMGHLNETGASIFTPVLWDVMTSSVKDNADKFYGSYAEKLENESAEIYGVYYTDVEVSAAATAEATSNADTDANSITDDSTIAIVRRYTIASNREGMQYKVIRTIDPPADSDGTEVANASISANGTNRGVPLLPTKETIQNYNDNTTFDLPIDQHGELQISGIFNGKILELKVRY